ncbi:MAG: exodeoxyribonuclease III [Sphingobacteriales bacterium]|nr:exodeoxyribonuclease III [Sphingobacteriales bacterium]
MRIISYNVNGIRSAMSKGLVDFMQSSGADVFCFQETKALQNQVEPYLFDVAGYPHQYWFSAEKKGYSGVAIFCKQKPDHISYGFNDPAYDNEGRIIRADFGDISVISVYMPSGSSGDERQAYKMKWLKFFTDYIHQLQKERPHLIICGDYNICHKPIDIHDPISNKNSSGFLPEERDWLDQFITNGFIDTFRVFNPEPHQYSWWSYRANARNNNKGWRIDYCLASDHFTNQVKDAGIMQEIKHSDHCPVWVEI